MGTLRITNFGGSVPKLGARVLPDNMAQFAINAKLYSGELRPYWKPKLLATLSTPANPQDVYHFQYNGNDYYTGFTVPTDVVRAPLINDAYNRVYFTNTTGAFVTTQAALAAGGSPAPYLLGLPQPTFSPSTGPTIVVTGGTVSLTETRVYTWVYVSGFGEESQFSVVVSATGPADGTWTITGINTLVSQLVTYPNIVSLRMYRTVTGNASVVYRWVEDFPIGSLPATTVDSVTDVTLSTNFQATSQTFIPPPSGLLGLIASPNGWLAGFVGRTVYFSQPYYPHAWPQQYELAVEDPIVGLGIYESNLCVMTTGRPYIINGTVPGAMTLTKVNKVLPCENKRSIVSTLDQVCYASYEGLVSINDTIGIGVVSTPYTTKDEWQTNYSPSTIMAQWYEGRYLAFYSTGSNETALGFILGFDDPNNGFVNLQYPDVTAIQADYVTGQVLMIVGQQLYQFDGAEPSALTYDWRSKQFVVPKPQNFGVIQLRGNFNASQVTPPPAPPAPPTTPWSINALGASALAASGAINSWPIDGPGYVNEVVIVDNTVSVKIYGDYVLRWAGVIASENPVRLPSGFKASVWEMELAGDVFVWSATLANTGADLATVP